MKSLSSYPINAGLNTSYLLTNILRHVSQTCTVLSTELYKLATDVAAVIQREAHPNGRMITEHEAKHNCAEN